MNAPGRKPRAASAAVAQLAKSAIRGLRAEPDFRPASQRSRNRGNQCTEDEREVPLVGEVQVLFFPACRLFDPRQVQYYGSIGQVGAFRKMIDSIENHRPRDVENHFIRIRIEFACGRTASCCQPTKSI